MRDVKHLIMASFKNDDKVRVCFVWNLSILKMNYLCLYMHPVRHVISSRKQFNNLSR